MSTRSISSGCWNRNDNLLDMTQFFEFLQVAMGNRKSLSCGIKDADWQRLFDFCKRQALIGIGFAAVERLEAPLPPSRGVAMAVQKDKDKAEHVECHGRKAVIEYVKMQCKPPSYRIVI